MSERTYSILLFLTTTNLKPIKLLLALSSLLWCVMLAAPDVTFSRPTYSVMASIASENIWAIAFGVHSVLLIVSLFVKKNTLLFIDALLGSLLWTVAVFCMLFAVYPPPAAISSEISSAVASWWILLTYDNNNT